MLEPSASTLNAATAVSESPATTTVVGVGASVGGLHAFSRLLRSVPAAADAACVLVMQLGARPESALVDSLRKRSKLEVSFAVDGARPRANAAYVIPPDQELALEQGVFRVRARSKSRAEGGLLDVLFATLEEHFSLRHGQPPARAAPAAQKGVNPKGLVARLRHELAATKERLASSSEELQSMNEELRTSNEELQASNEGLERSQQELQAMNTELAGVNARLVEKVAEATRASNDIANLLTSGDIATLLLDGALRVSRFTEAATAIFALQPRDAGRPIAELRLLADYPRFLDDARAVLLGGEPIETQIRSTKQRAFMARLAPYLTREGQIQGVVATFADVTSLDNARSALRENAEQLRALVDNVAVGIAITDLRGRVVDVNPALCAMLGWEREALIGRSFEQHVHPDGRQHMRELHADLVAGRRPHCNVEDRYLRTDGTTLWARVSVSLVQPAGGAKARAVYVIQDVSEAKRHEKQLRAQEGLARLGEMAAAIAHEVRSPLVAILSAVEILVTRIPEGPTERGVIGEIRQRIGAVDSLVSELLLFARPKDVKFSRVQILHLLREVSASLPGTGDLGEVEVILSGEDAEILGDADLLKSVFVNLATNAAQAMNGKGELRVQVEPGADAISVVFSDTGPGVPAAIADRIFEPFFTTRSQGIGLGLSLARRIVEAHGGEIALLPSMEHGTTLSIRLPFATARRPPADASGRDPGKGTNS